MQLARFIRLGHPRPSQFLIEKPLILRDKRGFGCVKCPRRTDIIIKGGKLLVGPTDEIVIVMALNDALYSPQQTHFFCEQFESHSGGRCNGIVLRSASIYITKSGVFTQMTANQTKSDRQYSSYCLLVNPCLGYLTRFNKIATQGTPQMAVDKEAICLSRVYSYYYKCKFPLFYVYPALTRYLSIIFYDLTFASHRPACTSSPEIALSESMVHATLV